MSAAAQYLAEGWAVVPVERGTKSPKISGWPGLAAAREFAPEDFEGANVGVVLGPVSKGLTDVDLDSAAALELAGYFLPPTRTFGRQGKRASHWLYYSPGARSDQLKFGPKGKRELIEIRAQNKRDDDCGHQSIFPGSVHTSGEPIEWENDEPIAAVDAGELAWAVARLAVACVVLDGWTEGAGRNVKSLGIAGGLLKMGWKGDEVEHLMASVRQCSGVDREDDERAVSNTIRAFTEGKEVTGFSALTADGDIEPHDLAAIRKHATTPAARAVEALIAKSKLGSRGLRDKLVKEARRVDGMGQAAEVISKLSKPAHVDEPDEVDEPYPALGRVVDLSLTPKPIDYLCRGLRLAPGKISALSGFAGTGKGPLLTHIALCVATGLPIFGQKTKRARVLYTDFETGRLAVVRAHRIARGLGIDLTALQNDGWFLFLDGSGMYASPDWLEEHRQAVQELQIGLSVVDSYTSAVPGDQNESAIADVAWELGAQSNQLGVTVLGAVHEKKTQQKRADNALQMVSGHNALVAAMQTTISVTRPDESAKSCVQLHCARAPDEGFDPIDVEWKDVPDPDLDVGQSKGSYMKAITLGTDPMKWALRAQLITREQSERRAVKQQTADEIELERRDQILDLLQSKGPMKKTPIADLLTIGRLQSRYASLAALYQEGVLIEDGGFFSVAPPSRETMQTRLKYPALTKSEKGS